MLFVMRHGKTDWNADRRMQGKTDIPLNEEGRKMAKQAAVEYADIHFDVCFCSPLSRARETAEIFLAQRNIPIYYDDRLEEMGFGVFEGVANSFKIPDCPINVFFEHPENYIEPVEGGERLEDVLKRAKEFIDEVVTPLLNDNKDVLIIGHGALNHALINQFRQAPLELFWDGEINNCKLYRLF